MNNRLTTQRGFTLVELLIAFTLSLVAMAALLSCFVFLARNFTRLANFRTLEQQSRVAQAYLQEDLAAAIAVKASPAPTDTALALQLPDGNVTYTYDATNGRLRRQADFGAIQDRYLLSGPGCRCATFAFSYFTASGGSVASQLAPTANAPLSIQQAQVKFTLETPATENSQTRANYAGGTARLHLRNKQKPDGS
jgi:prepilin-type N-terminal cleavage/methylation domain-containing protein